MHTTIYNTVDHIPDPLRPMMDALGAVAIQLSRRIAKGAAGGDLGAAVGANTDGDQQKALDVIADDEFAQALQGANVKWYASEEQDDVVHMDPSGAYGLAIDPLDGSSNIDVNVSIGTIFSIMSAKEEGQATFLRPACDQLGGGYFIYGPQTALIVTFGAGVQHYILDPDTQMFHLVNVAVTTAADSREFAINASNYRHWSKPIRAYIDDCLAGAEGPRSKDFNMRWVASLVAETHRILMRGGIFLYPSDDRDGYHRGRLRHVYECAPIAFVMEQAQGRATDGMDPILSKTPEALHARTPLVFGSPEKVDRVTSYHDLPDSETNALFARRGLFRA